MKNIKYVFFILCVFFVNVFYVRASCTNEEITNLKEDTKKIKITYKHLGEVDLGEGEVYYNYFKLKANNLSDDFYVLLSKNTNRLIPNNGIIETTVYSGKWDFHIYSNKCGMKINTIEIIIPTFNIYSLDPLCEGIDANDFELCSKYYEYNIGYDDFVQRVTRYRDINNVGMPVDDEIFINKYLNKILVFFNQYELYFLVGFIALMLIILIILLLRKRRKRGVLE